MEFNYDHIDKIEKYLSGEMSRDEANAFEELIKGDTVLADEVQWQKMANEVVVQARLSEVSSIVADVVSSSEVPSSSRWKTWLGGGISLLVIVGGLFLLNENEGPKSAEVSSQDAPARVEEHSVGASVESRSENKSSVVVEEGVENAQGEGISQMLDAEDAVEVAQEQSLDTPEVNLDAEIKTEDNKVETPASTSVDEEKVATCDGVVVKAEWKTRETCESKFEGKISLAGEVSGGTAPFSYSLDGDEYGPFSTFALLGAGEYTLQIMDANGCFSEIRNIAIGDYDCSLYELAFDQNIMDRVEWPELAPEDVKVVLSDRTGAIVKSMFVAEGDPISWDGYTNKNMLGSTGNYPFTMIFSSGRTVTGSVTILK